MVEATAAGQVTTPEEYLARARALASLLADRADATEQRRSADPEMIARIKGAGFFRLTQPRRVGGAELPLKAMHDVVRTLAHGCPSTAWVLMVTLAHTWILGMYPEEVQDEIAADDPDTVISGSLAANGEAIPVEGGYRVSGRFPFASGVDHARWNLIGVHVVGDVPDWSRQIHVMAPVSDYQVNDNWFVMGLKGTGSKELVLDDVFVPARRAMPSGILFNGRAEAALRHPTRLHVLPVITSLGYHHSAVMLGMAESAHALALDRMRVSSDKYTGGSKAERAGLQFRIAEADMEIRSAELLLDQVPQMFDAYAREERLPTLDERAELRFVYAYATKLCRQAVERVFAAAGANACYEISPLQARFRDLTVASHHAAVDFDSAAEQFGRVRLGLKPSSRVL
jgi:alkylation response protein AidB-like acyl-CoA dehydrogenase